MKIKKLAAYAKQCGKGAMLMTTRTFEGEPLKQYVHVGAGIYPIDGLGQLDPEMLLTVFDVVGSERDGWNIAEKEITDFVEIMTKDNLPCDKAMNEDGITFETNISTLITLSDEMKSETVFIDRDALKPVDDVDERTFWLRDVGAGKVLIVKSGFMNVAAIGLATSYWMAEPMMRAANKAWQEKMKKENELGVKKAMSAMAEEGVENNGWKGNMPALRG